MSSADQRFIEEALQNPINRTILERLGALELEQPWLVAGCVYGTVWNLLSDRPVTENIKDYDVFYWDEDVSWEAEDRVIKGAAELFSDIDAEIEFRNQKRVPLWFEKRFGAPYPTPSSAKDCIGKFLVECTCVGIGVEEGAYMLEAPFRLEDVYKGRLVYNQDNPTPHNFQAKAESYKARWPWLEIVGGSGP